MSAPELEAELAAACGPVYGWRSDDDEAPEAEVAPVLAPVSEPESITARPRKAPTPIRQEAEGEETAAKADEPKIVSLDQFRKK